MTKKPASNKARPIARTVKPKRNMFAELMEGMEALRAHRLGKCVLPTHVVERHASR